MLTIYLPSFPRFTLFSAFYPLFRVLPSFPRFTLFSAFYPLFRVLPSIPRFTLYSAFYPLFRVLPSIPFRFRVLPLPQRLVSCDYYSNINFKFSEISMDDIICQLRNLKISKSTGIDNIPAIALKLSAEVIGPSLTWIYNLSIKTGIVC